MLVLLQYGMLGQILLRGSESNDLPLQNLNFRVLYLKLFRADMGPEKNFILE